jgi:hypothetical protein
VSPKRDRNTGRALLRTYPALLGILYIIELFATISSNGDLSALGGSNALSALTV